MLRPRIILFLSTGDTCRSPMAAAYLRHLLDKHGVRGVDVRTAGVSTIVGLLASQETLQVLKSEELDASRHRSNQMSSEVLHRATLVLGMTPFHVQSALRLYEGCRGRVFLLKEFARSDLKKVQIDDPMGGTLEIYRRCFNEIKAAVDKLILIPDAVGADLRGKVSGVAGAPKARPKAEPKPVSVPARPPASSKSTAVKSHPVRRSAKKRPVKVKSSRGVKAKSRPAAKAAHRSNGRGRGRVRPPAKRTASARKHPKPARKR